MITLCPRDSAGPRPWSHLVLRIAKGASIYHEGDLTRHWFQVVSGTVRTCRFLADGHRQLTGFYFADDVFGVDGSNYSEAAEAVTDVVVRRFPNRILEDPPVQDMTLRDQVLERALEIARQSIFLFGHKSALSRVAAFLIGVADRSNALPGIQLPMSRADIADHLNLTLHTVSRTISDLARQGLITLDGPQNARILDLDGLRVAAGEAGQAFDRHSHATSGAKRCKSA